MATVLKISSTEGLLAMQDDWESLTKRAREHNVFLAFDWLFTWWRRYGEGKGLNILAVREGRELIGLAPLMSDDLTVAGLPAIRRLLFLGTGISDRLDVISVPGMERAVLEALSARLLEEEWDIIDLQEITEDSKTSDILSGIWNGYGEDVAIETLSVCPVIELPNEPDAYLSSLGNKTRDNICYFSRRLRKKYDVKVEILMDGPGLADGMNAFLELYGKARHGHPDIARFDLFRKEAAERLARDGRLFLAFLRLDGSTAAGELNWVCGDTLFAYNTCYDHSLKGESPGTVLMWEVIKHLISNGFRRYDLLRGEELHKNRWGVVPRRQVRVRIRRKTLKTDVFKAGSLIYRLLKRIGAGTGATP